MNRTLIWRAVLLCVSLLPAQAQTLSLSGTDWRIKDVPAGAAAFCPDWLPATVPGNIQADLETARLLRPMAYGAGDPRLYDVARNDWHYRKDFTVPADFAGKRLRLVFDGVDYACEVWLNGRKLGGNPNMFRRFEFEVADRVEIGVPNRLEVRLERAPAKLADFIQASDAIRRNGAGTNLWIGHGRSMTADILKDLKSPTNWGYDWGVNIWTLGIWKDVRLEGSGPAVVSSVKIETALAEDQRKATVRVAAEVDSQEAGAAQLRVRISGHGPERTVVQPMTLRTGVNAVRAEIVLDDPALWWPNGHGEQNLYTLEATVVGQSGRDWHTLRSRFGVREVRWEHTAEAPADFPEEYMPVINGRRIRMIGSNLIPPDLLFARIPERAPHLLRLAKASGFTTLRIWGGGVIFTPEVYDLADELGLMLMVEVPIANIDPKPDPELLKNLEITLPNLIRQVWNHPSVIEYTGGNEMRYGREKGDFTVIEHIRRIFAAVDPSRVFRDSDPTAGGAHGKWHFSLGLNDPVDPLGVYAWWNHNIPRVPDDTGAIPVGPRSHIYPVMRNGEFGYQTAGNLEVWQRDIPLSSQWPVLREDPILIRKNATQAIFDRENWLVKPVIDYLFGEAPDLEFLLKAGQYIGGEGLRYAMDSIRRRGAATGGMMSWDFNEPWTNGAGSYLIDYDGRPLMNHAFLKQAVAPLSLSLRHATALYDLREGIRTTLYLTSDAAQAAAGLGWSWRVRDRRGAVIGSGRGTVGIDPLEVRKLAEIALPLPAKTAFGPYLLELQLSDAQGKPVHERLHIFGLKGVRAPLQGLLADNLLDPDDDPAQLQALLDRPGKPDATGSGLPEVSRPVKRTTLTMTAGTPRVEGEEEVLELALTNTGEMTALFCEPKPVLNYRTDLIIDNLHVSIPPGESRTITIRAPRRAKDGLSLGQTGWRIESWNAGALEIKPSPTVILSLGRADRMGREFAGYPGLSPAVKDPRVRVEGNRPEAGKIPYLLGEGRSVEFAFAAEPKGPGQPARLRIHSSDQSVVGAALKVTLNGKVFAAHLPEGYGLQQADPAHLARAQTAEIAIPAGVLKPADNVLRIETLGSGWFTWDALDLTGSAP